MLPAAELIWLPYVQTVCSGAVVDRTRILWSSFQRAHSRVMGQGSGSSATTQLHKGRRPQVSSSELLAHFMVFAASGSLCSSHSPSATDWLASAFPECTTGPQYLFLHNPPKQQGAHPETDAFKEEAAFEISLESLG